MDSDSFAHFFEQDASFVFANNPPAKGHAEIRGVADYVFNRLSAISHQVVGSWPQDNCLLVEGVVSYTLKDPQRDRLDLGFFCVFRFSKENPHLIQSYRSYIDASQVFVE